MDYITELRMHYEGVKRRLHGLSGPTGLRVPKPPAPPVEKTATETVFVIDTPRSRFVKMLKEVAAMHGIDPAEVMEKNRKYSVVRVRQEVFAKAHDDLNLSFSHIGRIMDLDHTTVMHGYRKYKKSLLSPEQIALHEDAINYDVGC